MKEQLYRRVQTASGEKKAQLVLKSAEVLNVFTEELESADVAISDGYIVGVGQGYEGEQEIELPGMIICPGKRLKSHAPGVFSARNSKHNQT